MDTVCDRVEEEEITIYSYNIGWEGGGGKFDIIEVQYRMRGRMFNDIRFTIQDVDNLDLSL